MKIALRRKTGSKAADAPAPTAPAEQDSYIDAQRVWFERYGTYVAQAYNWRLLAMIEAVALVCAVVGLIYLASQTKFVPYVVAVDKVGMAFAVHPAEQAAQIDPRVVRAELGAWLVDARSVVTDRIVALDDINKTYAFVATDSPAFGYLNSYYPTNGHSPLVRAESETDTVNVSAILPISPTSYEMQWTETIRDLHGHTKGPVQNWDGTATIAFRAPTDEQTILRNPLGMYITEVNWTQKL